MERLENCKLYIINVRFNNWFINWENKIKFIIKYIAISILDWKKVKIKIIEIIYFNFDKFIEK